MTFNAFETNGSDVQDTHLMDAGRMDKLVVVVSVACSWACKTDIYAHEHLRPNVIKAHSLFKYGLNSLFNAVFVKVYGLDLLIQVLSGTKLLLFVLRANQNLF